MLNTKLKLSVAVSAILISQAVIAATPDANGMTLWLDASDRATLFTDKTCTGAQAIALGNVSCWKDKSGKNDVIVATNAASPPKLLDKAQNNKAVVDFTQTALITKDKDQIKTNGSYTKFVVFKLDNEDGNKDVNKLSKHNLIGSDPYQTTLWADNGMLHSQHKGSTTNYLNSKKKLGITKYHIAVTRYSKPDYDPANPNKAISNILNLDGKREASNFDDAKHTAARTSIGGVGKNGTGENYFYLDGKIAEALVYNRSLSNAEITKTEKYLAKKWKLDLGQSITFDKPKNQVKGNPAIQLHAVSSSGIKVVFTSKTLGICKISKGSEYVTLDAVGTCKIEANAAKSTDGTYPKAAPVVQSFEIKAVKDNTTEAPSTTTPSSSGGSKKSGGSPLPLGLALLGLIALIRRKLDQK
jgi:MYXO-CTERM domain-containing protein